MSMKLVSGELEEDVGQECREGAEFLVAVSVWWILALKKVMKVSHCVTVSR